MQVRIASLPRDEALKERANKLFQVGVGMLLFHNPAHHTPGQPALRDQSTPCPFLQEKRYEEALVKYGDALEAVTDKASPLYLTILNNRSVLSRACHGCLLPRARAHPRVLVCEVKGARTPIPGQCMLHVGGVFGPGLRATFSWATLWQLWRTQPRSWRRMCVTLSYHPSMLGVPRVLLAPMSP